jgi:hypothetical protein
MVASFEQDYINHVNPKLLIINITQASRQRVLPPLLADLHNLLKYIFVCSWDIILDAITRHHNKLKLQQAVQAGLEGEATAATVIDHKPPPGDMKTLNKALISSMVGTWSNKILDKFNAIEQRQLRPPQPKNEQTGDACNNQKKKESKKQAQPKSNNKVGTKLSYPPALLPTQIQARRSLVDESSAQRRQSLPTKTNI